MDERENIVSYLEQVRSEVARRREVVREIEASIGTLEQTIKKHSAGVALDVRTLKAGEGRKAQVHREIAVKRTALEAALSDLRRAEEREQDVVTELSEFDAGDRI